MSEKTKGQKTLPIHNCEPGDVIAKDIHNPDGQKVVSKDKELTSKLIKRLSGTGVRRITVYSEETEEEVFAEPITPEKETEYEVKETEEGLLVNGDLTDEFTGDRDIILDGNLQQGASITATGDVRVKGQINGGKIESREGNIQVNGTLRGDDVELIAEKLINVNTVEEAEVSVTGNLLVHGEVSEADIDCIGDMVVHQQDGKAQLADSEVRVEGRLLADEVENSSKTTKLSFEDPEKKELKRKKNRLINKIEDLEEGYARLEKMVDTVRELKGNVKELSDEKKEKLKEYIQRFKRVKSDLEQSEQKIEKTKDRLEELNSQRRYFMKVLNTLRKDTEITMENTMVKTDEDEWDVKLYKKSMIVIQDAEDDPDNIKDWFK